MAHKLIIPAQNFPINLEEAKTHLRIDGADQDDRINIWIASACDYVERFLGRALIDQTWELALDGFPAAEIKLPVPPLIEVISVAYSNSGGGEQVLDPSLYAVDTISEPGRVQLLSGAWPVTFTGINTVRVRFRAGFIDSSVSPPTGTVPELIRGAILLRIEADYDDDVVNADKLRAAVDVLLRRRRFDLSMA